jgi:hypothetical protein
MSSVMPHPPESISYVIISERKKKKSNKSWRNSPALFLD